MWNKKIILTSDKDFAKTICGENAYYFNPFDVDDISKKIITAYSDTQKTKMKVEKAFSSVEDMPNWEQIYFSLINLFTRNNETKI